MIGRLEQRLPSRVLKPYVNELVTTRGSRSYIVLDIVAATGAYN